MKCTKPAERTQKVLRQFQSAISGLDSDETISVYRDLNENYLDATCVISYSTLISYKRRSVHGAISSETLLCLIEWLENNSVKPKKNKTTK